MSEPYYRISTAQSELERLLYGQKDLTRRLELEGQDNAARGINDGIPRMASIKNTHRYPFKLRFEPVVISATQWISHTNATNNRFNIDYGAELMGRMYQAVDIGEGEIAEASAEGTWTAALFAYCKNFAASYLTTASFKVSTDTIYEMPGQLLFAWYSLCVPFGARPALMRSLKETTFEFRWTQGAGTGAFMDAGGVTDTVTSIASLELVHPNTPIQAYAGSHAAFTFYIPYNVFTMANVVDAYPLVSVYSLQRSLEYTFGTLLNSINIFMDSTDVAGSDGLVQVASAGVAGVYTWTTLPAFSATRLMVEYYTLHKDLQRVLAMNPHGFLIRQFHLDTETLTDKTSRDISLTKIIETLYIIIRHSRNVTQEPVNTGVALVTDTVTPVDQYTEVDPFYLPVDTNPINTITLSARGQVFFKDLQWEEISAVFPFMFTTATMGTTVNNCLAIITFGLWYFDALHTSTYNSGYGPNLRLAWTAHAFSASVAGIMNIIIQSVNMVLAYRGALSIRYT